VGIVSVDLCYVHSEIRDKVISRVADLGLDEQNLLIAATHSHSGFGSFDSRFLADKMFGKFNPQIQEHLVKGIVEALKKAHQRKRPALVEHGAIELKGMNRSRRDPAFDFDIGGTGDFLEFDPEKYPTDRKLSVIRFTAEDESQIGLIYNFASHPTVLSPKNMALSADWPGVACAKIENHFGGDGVALFLNGALGDAAPLPDWSDLKTEWKSVQKYGDKMGDAVIRALGSLNPLEQNQIFSHTNRKEFKRLVIRSWNRMRLPKGLSKIGYKRPDQPLQALRLGEIVMMAVPGEPTTLVGKELKSLCPEGLKCLVVAPANGYLGYFVVSEEYEEGGYAPSSCLFGMRGTQNVINGMTEALSEVR